MPEKLDTLEKELIKIRSGDLPPLTQLLWKSEEDFITQRARELCRGNAKIMEVGCGQGKYLISLAKEPGNECYGIDPLREVSIIPAQQKARENNVNINLICAAGENIPFPDEMFDVVLLLSTLQHVADQNKVLLEIRRVLKPEGRLLVSVPQRQGLYSGRLLLSEIKRMVQAREKVFTMDFHSKKLKMILAENGFKVDEFHGRKFLPILLPTLLSALLKMHRDRLVMKIIDISDNIADKTHFAASSFIVLCRKEKGN